MLNIKNNWIYSVINCWQFTWIPTLICSFKKLRKLGVVFTFQQTKRHDQMQCQRSIANKSENSETPIKQCANDKLRNLLERQLITRPFSSVFVMPREIWSRSLAGSVVNNLCQKLPLQLFSNRVASRRKRLVTYFWVVLYTVCTLYNSLLRQGSQRTCKSNVQFVELLKSA